MKLYNIKFNKQHVSFIQAVQLGIGMNQGLFFPMHLPKFTAMEISSLLKMNFITRSAHILSTYIGNELSMDEIINCITIAFNFPVKNVSISQNIKILELFHGPTLAFKDFGGRFMAQILKKLNHNKSMTILTATSGDTGAAIAHAFYNFENIRVIILYPKNKISLLQEKLFCTLGNNIYTIAIDGDFDICQSLVKQAFNDNELRKKLKLNSANSINISRLLAQICYYFEAVAQVPLHWHNQLVISIPSGNCGNLTAGLLAKSLGLPIKRFIIATNINDTIPRFLRNKKWQPNPTISTLSNAMDISQPNNWPRIEELFLRKKWSLNQLAYGCVDDTTTIQTIKEIANLGYISEPHAAISYRLLRDQLKSKEFGLFIATAHPAKFKNIIDNILQCNLLLPSKLLSCMHLPNLSITIDPNFYSLRKLILEL